MLGVVFRLIYCGCVVYGFLSWGCAVYVSCGYVLRLVLLIFMVVEWVLYCGMLWWTSVCVGYYLLVCYGLFVLLFCGCSGCLLCGLALYCEVDVTYNAGYFGWCVWLVLKL